VPGDPLGPHAATPAELRERLAAERRGTPFLVLRDGDDRQVVVTLDPAHPHRTIGRGAGRGTTSRCPGTRRSRARTPSWRPSATTGSSATTTCRTTGRSSTASACTAAAVTPAQRRVLVALCRPVADGGAPASNRAIADELVVALDTVKGTLSRLFEAFSIGEDVPQNAKRAALARRALQLGVVHPDDLVRDRSA
jgi:DNA-binding NarL/FixJ family response regulator